jgi:hypothetical protein
VRWWSYYDSQWASLGLWNLGPFKLEEVKLLRLDDPAFLDASRRATSALSAITRGFRSSPWVRVPIGRRICSVMAAVLSNDRRRMYRHPIYFAETFIDPEVSGETATGRPTGNCLGSRRGAARTIRPTSRTTPSRVAFFKERSTMLLSMGEPVAAGSMMFSFVNACFLPPQAAGCQKRSLLPPRCANEFLPHALPPPISR